MKVMTFNIRGSFQDDGINRWDKRRELNITTILKYDPDIIGFQEAQQGNFDDYAEPLSAYNLESGPMYVQQTAEYYRVPIYWKKDRFRICDSGGFYLSETPDVWSVGWDAVFTSCVTWVRLQDAEGTTFVILNTHFPHRRDKDETRVNCSKLMLARLEAIATDSPVMVVGDFNALPTDRAYSTMTGSILVDTYTAAGHTEDASTYHGFKGEDFEYQDGRFDRILVRGFSTNDCIIITDAKPPLYPSDHYPLLVDVLIEPK